MAPTATGTSDAANDLAGLPGAAVLGRLTVPGRPEHVRAARSFVAKALGDLHPVLDTAILVTSELVTNAVVHSRSRRSGGTVTLLIMESAGGVRIEVTDQGSDLSAPVVRGEIYASDGHGLFLVQTLADQWGYLRQPAGTTVWCWLSPARSPGRSTPARSPGRSTPARTARRPA